MSRAPRGNGFCSIGLEVSRDSVARGFYSSHGFAAVGEEGDIALMRIEL